MLCDFRLCRKMNARIWHQSWTLKTLSRTAKTKQVTTLQPFQSSCRVRKVASITRSDGLHSCDVWHGLQKPTSSCLQIDVTDSNLVQVLKDRNKEPFVHRFHRDLQVAGFRVQSAHHYTMEPNDTALVMQFLKSSPLDNAYLFACVNVVNSWKSSFLVDSVARERWWCSGEHSCLPSTDSRPTQGGLWKITFYSRRPCHASYWRHQSQIRSQTLFQPAMITKPCQHFLAHYLWLQVRASVTSGIHELLGSA